MSSLSLEVVLELVDRLTGPAREAAKGLEQFGAAARQAGSADAALRPDKWLEEGRAIVAAADGAKAFATSALDAAEAEKKLGAPWAAMTGEIDRSTSALKAFNEQLDAAANKKLPLAPGGRPGSGGHGEPSPLLQLGENAGEMAAMFEGPKAIETIVGGGAHLADEAIAQRIAGMTPQQIAEARARAVELQAEFPQFTLTEILAQTREARAIMANDEAAGKAVAIEMKLAALADRAHPGQGVQETYPVLRALEEGGFANDWHKAEAVADAIARSQNVMGSKIRSEDYQNLFQRAGAFGRNWSMEFIRDKLPHLLASQGGDAVGTMLATLGQGVLGGHVMGPAADALYKLGILDPKKVEIKDGHVKHVQPGAFLNSALEERDPVKWVQDVLWPRIEKAAHSDEEKLMLLTAALANRNESKAAFMSVADKELFERDAGLIKDNEGVDAIKHLKDDPVVQWQAVKSSLETLSSVASEPAMTTVANGLHVLAAGISGLSQAAAAHPLEGVASAAATVVDIARWGLKGLLGVGSKLGAVGENTPSLIPAVGAWSSLLRLLGLAGPLTLPAALAEGGDSLSPQAKAREDADREAILKSMEATPGLSSVAAAIRRLNNEPVAPPSSYDPALDPNSVQNRLAAARALRHAGYRPGEAQDEAEREGTHPHVPAAEAAAKAKEATEALKALDTTRVAPKVDASAIDTLIAKLREAVGLVGSINSGVAAASRRASFAGALHDGPEAR